MVIIIGGKTTIVSRKENKEPKEQRTQQVIHIFAVPVAPQWPPREKRTRLGFTQRSRGAKNATSHAHFAVSVAPPCPLREKRFGQNGRYRTFLTAAFYTINW